MNMDGADEPKKPNTYSKPTFRRPTRRCTYIIVAVTILCIIICIILAVHLSAKSKDECSKGIHCDWRSMPHSEFLKDERCDFLCTSLPCIRSAHYSLSRIDSSKDPCEDFYEFSCGTYEKEAILFPENSEGIYTYQEMENEMILNVKEIIDSIAESPGKKGFSLRLTKKIYDDCMNTDSQKDVLTKDIWKKMFANDGMLPWPLLNDNAMNDQKHLVKLMSSSLFYFENPFFTTFLGDGPQEKTVNNKTQWVFQFMESENLDTLKAIHKDSNAEDEGSVFARYLFVWGKIMTEVGVDVDELKNILPKIHSLEKYFLQAVTKAIDSNEKVYEKNEHLRHEYHDHSCQELDHRMGNIKWCKIVEQLRADYGLPVKSQIRISLPSVADYFAAVNTVLGSFLDRDVINYIALKFIMGHLQYMPSPLREIYYREKDLFPRARTNWRPSARWQQCVEIVTELMAFPLEKEYMLQKLNEEKRAKVRHMVNKIKKTYMSVIDKMSWMKALLRGQDTQKLIKEMKIVIGTPDAILFQNHTAVDKYLESGISKSVLNNPQNPLIADVLEINKLSNRARYSLNGDIHYMFVHSLSFSALRSYVSPGEIEIPQSMIGSGMFLTGRPMYAEYATLGSYIFRYITELLSVSQSADDNSTLEAGKNILNCFQEQYHLYKTGKIKFKVDVPDEIRLGFEFINALGTLGSFQAYTDHLAENGEDKGLPGLPFSNKQLFFISNAQLHCEKFTEKGYANFPKGLVSPARFRVNIPLANSKEFSEVFQCPSGSSMNPKRKCCILGDGILSHECK